MATLASTERLPKAKRQAPRLLRAQGVHAPEHLFFDSDASAEATPSCVLKVSSQKSNFRSPGNLSNFGAPGKLAKQLRCSRSTLASNFRTS